MIEHSYFWNFDKNARIRENMQKRVVFPRGRFLIQSVKTRGVNRLRKMLNHDFESIEDELNVALAH